MKIISINPSNNEILGEIQETTKEEVIEKVNSAKSVQSKWTNLEIEKSFL